MDGYEQYYFNLVATQPDWFIHVPHVLWTREFIARAWTVSEGRIAPFLPVEFHPHATNV